MRPTSLRDKTVVAGANIAALIVCGLLSNWLGNWLLWAWFVGAVAITTWLFHRNSPTTYIAICAALAAATYFSFWHPLGAR